MIEWLIHKSVYNTYQNTRFWLLLFNDILLIGKLKECLELFPKRVTNYERMLSICWKLSVMKCGKHFLQFVISKLSPRPWLYKARHYNFLSSRNLTLAHIPVTFLYLQIYCTMSVLLVTVSHVIGNIVAFLVYNYNNRNHRESFCVAIVTSRPAWHLPRRSTCPRQEKCNRHLENFNCNLLLLSHTPPFQFVRLGPANECP